MDYNPISEVAIIRVVAEADVPAAVATVGAGHILLIRNVAVSTKLITVCEIWYNMDVLLERLSSITRLQISYNKTTALKDHLSHILIRQ
jgi:hypothetical protein